MTQEIFDVQFGKREPSRMAVLRDPLAQRVHAESQEEIRVFRDVARLYHGWGWGNKLALAAGMLDLVRSINGTSPEYRASLLARLARVDLDTAHVYAQLIRSQEGVRARGLAETWLLSKMQPVAPYDVDAPSYGHATHFPEAVQQLATLGLDASAVASQSDSSDAHALHISPLRAPSELAVGDVLMWRGTQADSGKPNVVGFVSGYSAESGYDIMWPDWRGIGLASFSKVKTDAHLAEMGQMFGRYGEFVISRSPEAEVARELAAFRKGVMYREEDLPPTIRAMSYPDRYPVFDQIPEIAPHLQRLRHTNDIRTAAQEIWRMIPMIGVELQQHAHWKPEYYLTEDGPYRCIYYSAMIAQLLLGAQCISRFVDEQERPAVSGRELSAATMNLWLNRHHSRFGWEDVTWSSRAERQEMLEQGCIIYATEAVPTGDIGDTAIIAPFVTRSDRIVPAITKASLNVLIGSPYAARFFDSPEQAATAELDSLFAHKLPGFI